MAATSFPLFMYLPFELRARIWELTAEPRTIKVFKPSNVVKYPIPPIVQACREARELGVYRKVYPKNHSLTALNQRYSWVNAELDFVDLTRGYSDMTMLQPYASMITRLRIWEPHADCMPRQLLALARCTNLKELHIVLEDPTPALDWHYLFTVFPLACGTENMFTVDPALGTVAALRPKKRTTGEDIEMEVWFYECTDFFQRRDIKWGTEWAGGSRSIP